MSCPIDNVWVFAESRFDRGGLLRGNEDAAEDVLRVAVRIGVVLLEGDGKGAAVETLREDRSVFRRIRLLPLADDKSSGGRRYAVVDEHIEPVPKIGSDRRQDFLCFP
uniref:Uncharacterized protein n=2 Tax=Rhizobium leguminosarum TaxID=384 RepID=A0A0U3I6D3_RHILV|nr:hypothetical protein [Rhizobium leguminosarum bv. viciae]KZB02874.1 hypothetical protein A4A59_08400 [Rhizobium leguminosarum]